MTDGYRTDYQIGFDNGVASERQRLGLDGPRAEMTDEEIAALWDATATYGNAVIARLPPFARALLASQADRETMAERERCARWHDTKRKKLEDQKARWSNPPTAMFDDEIEYHGRSAAAHRAGEEG